MLEQQARSEEFAGRTHLPGALFYWKTWKKYPKLLYTENPVYKSI